MYKIIKSIEERETKKKKKRQEKTRGIDAIVRRWELAKWFCCAFKLDFFQVIN